MRHVIIILLVMSLSSHLVAQISNNNIDYHLQLYQVNWYNTGHEGGNVEVAWRVKTRTSGAFDANCETYNAGYTCVWYTDEDRHYPQKELIRGSNVAIGTKVHYKVYAWENDDTNSSRYCTHDLGDDLLHCGRGAPTPSAQPISTLHMYPLHNVGGANQSEIQLKSYWSYANGQWGQSAALNFGTIQDGQTKIHDNSTTGKTISGNFYGYKSTFSHPDATTYSGNDVVYNFYIADTPKRVTFQATNVAYETNLHLLRVNGDGTFTYLRHSRGNPNNSFSYDLCPGQYHVVFEFTFQGTDNDFRLSLSGQEITTHPGEILAAEQSLCTGVDYPMIGSSQSAYSSPSGLTPDRYEWEKKIIGGEYSGEGFSEESAATLEPIGEMTDQDVIFRRRAYFCGTPTAWTYDTIKYQPSSITSGSIDYPYETFVRQGYPLEGIMTSTESGGGDPTPISYRWEYRPPNATQFVTVMDGSNPYGGEELTPTVFGALDQGATNVQRITINACGQEEVSNEIVIEGRLADGSIQGKVTARPLGAGPGVVGVQVCGVPIDSIYGTITVCDTTDEQGNYLLNDLYYDKTSPTRYEVIPRYLDHEIRTSETSDDSTRVISLNTTTHNISVGTDFVDLTVYQVTGNVYQVWEENGVPPTNYGKSKVVIYLEDVDTGIREAKDTTDANGDYALLIINAGTWKIIPELLEPGTDDPHAHTFLPPSRTLNINTDIINVNFENTTTMDISGFVGAGCDNYLGTVDLRFYQDAEDGDFDRTFTTNIDVGTFEYTLPAREYKVEYVDESLTDMPTGSMGQPLYNSAKVESQFAGFQFDAALSHADTTMTLYFREAPEVTVTGLPGLPECSTGTYDYMVLEQGEIYYDFELQAWEGDPENACPLDTGYVDIFDDIGGRGNGILPISEGMVDFVLLVGEPNVVPATQYLLSNFFSVRDFINPESADLQLTALVRGEKPKKSTFTTVSPEVPLLVLHDPPGDRSFSTYSSESVIETTINNFSRDADIQGGWIKRRKGLELSAELIPLSGVSFTSKAWLDISGEVSVEEVETFGDGTRLRLSNLETISTSDDDAFIGDQGDVFYGAAFNYIYSLTDKVDFDYASCMVDTSTSFFLSPDSIATTFLKTTRAIENDINELKYLKSIASPDSATYFQNRINVWEQTLAKNRNYKINKANSSDPKQTLTFSNGVRKEETNTSTTDTTESFEFLLEIDAQFAIDAGLEIAGSGLSGGFYTKVRSTMGRDSTIRTTNTISTGYTLLDDDTDDEFFIDVYQDERYGTPLFVTTSAFSSCPYEAPEYLGVDQFDLAHHIDSEPIQTIPAPGQVATYTVVLSNNGPETRTYIVANDDAYNEGGAQVSIGGNAPGNDGEYTLSSPLDANPQHPVAVEIVITVTRAPESDVYSYRNIKINADPECSTGSGADETRQSLFLSASFEAECSTMDIASPSDNRIINIEDNNTLPITVINYDRDKVDRALLQYRRLGEQIWQSSADFDLAQSDLEIGSSGTLRNWDVSEVEEEGYVEIRMKITCTPPGSATPKINYSNIVLLHVDRLRPYVFGAPEPVDDDYDITMNDQISVVYSEPICAGGSTPAEAIIVDIVTGDTISTTVTCSDRQIIVSEQGASLGTRPPSLYRVILSGVADLQGNEADEYRWIFAVGDFQPEDIGCIAGLEITNNNENQDAINVSNYQAISIISDGVIPGFGTTTYESEETVEFEQGFQINSGGVFETIITQCEEDE